MKALLPLLLALVACKTEQPIEFPGLDDSDTRNDTDPDSDGEPPGDDSGDDCTMEDRGPSITVTVTDEGGQMLRGADLTFAWEGHDPEPCEAIGDVYACGSDTPGDYTVHAELQGYSPADADVTVDAVDVCHAAPEDLTLVVHPAD